MLLIGGYNSQLHVYTIGLTEKQFKYRFSLLGHMNSIKAIAISEEIEPDVRYIATGSQDCNIRVWKVKPLPTPENSMS